MGMATGDPYRDPLHTLLLPKCVQPGASIHACRAVRPSSAAPDRRASVKREKPPRQEWNTRIQAGQRTTAEYDAWKDPFCSRFFEGTAANRMAIKMLRASGKFRRASREPMAMRQEGNVVLHKTAKPASSQPDPPAPRGLPQCKLSSTPPPVLKSPAESEDDEILFEAESTAPPGASALILRLVVLFNQLSRRRTPTDGAPPSVCASELASALRALISQQGNSQASYEKALFADLEGEATEGGAQPPELGSEAVMIASLLAEQLEGLGKVNAPDLTSRGHAMQSSVLDLTSGEHALQMATSDLGSMQHEFQTATPESASSECEIRMATHDLASRVDAVRVSIDDVMGRACVIEAEQRACREACITPDALRLIDLATPEAFEAAFQELKESLIAAWRGADLPETEIDEILMRFGSANEVSSAHLATLLIAARRHARRTTMVLAAVEQREALLACLKLLVSRLPQNEDGKVCNAMSITMELELDGLVSLLRRASVQVVEAVQRWRGAMWRKLPFEYKGQNYLIRMKTDLHSLAQPQVIERLLHRNDGRRLSIDSLRLYAAEQAILIESDVGQETRGLVPFPNGSVSTILRWLPVIDEPALRNAIEPGCAIASGCCMYSLAFTAEDD